MSVKTATVTGANIAPHVKDTEWQCSDGTKTILYSTEILDMLEKLRAYVGGTLTINCGYRTQYHNDHMKPPGAKRSQHIQGTAADVVVKKDGAVIPAKLICCLAQTLGFKGIGYISANAVHLDMRESGTYRGDERSGYSGNVGNDFYAYFGVNMAQIMSLKVASATITSTIIAENIDYSTPSTALASEWEKAKTTGITDGTDPAKDVQRGQAIAFIVRKITNGATVQIADCAAYAKQRGISDGQNLTNIATRNQIIAMLYRAKNGQTEKDFATAWQWAIDNKITDGSNPSANATREQAAAFVLRSGI